jgi:hypothetical protein
MATGTAVLVGKLGASSGFIQAHLELVLLLATNYRLLTAHLPFVLTPHSYLLTTHYSLLTTHYSLLATHYSLLTTHYSLLTTHYSRLTH